MGLLTSRDGRIISRILLSGKNLALGICMTASKRGLLFWGYKDITIKSIIHISTNKELYESKQFMF
jgi:hypothetical protein